MDSLVHWKKKRDKYKDETDSDDTEIRGPRLCGTLQEVSFINRDETNANTMRKLKIKW